jgi:hypothetical protein
VSPDAVRSQWRKIQEKTVHVAEMKGLIMERRAREMEMKDL